MVLHLFCNLTLCQGPSFSIRTELSIIVYSKAVLQNLNPCNFAESSTTMETY